MGKQRSWKQTRRALRGRVLLPEGQRRCPMAVQGVAPSLEAPSTELVSRLGERSKGNDAVELRASSFEVVARAGM